MNGADLVYRELLYQAMEKKKKIQTQAELAKNLNISLSTVNGALRNLKNMGAIEVGPRNFHVTDTKKILLYWASTRNLHKDIVFMTRVEKPVLEIEKLMPDTIVFAAYTAYRLLFDDVPADYSEVYVYGDECLSTRFPKVLGPPNLFVLKKDALVGRYGGTTTIANTFVDLWNVPEWYAKEFVKAMEAALHGILE